MVYSERAAFERQQSSSFLKGDSSQLQLPDDGFTRAVLGNNVEHFSRLRDALEDYLEIQRSQLNLVSLDKYLSVDILAKYFRIIQVEAGDLIYDISEEADSVDLHDLFCL